MAHMVYRLSYRTLEGVQTERSLSASRLAERIAELNEIDGHCNGNGYVQIADSFEVEPEF